MGATTFGASAAAQPPLANGTDSGRTTFIDGASIEPERLAEWERRRADSAAARLSAHYLDLAGDELSAPISPAALAADDIDSARTALAQARASIGADGLRRMLAAEVATSDAVTRAALAASGNRWAVSAAEIVSGRGSSEGFADWFTREREADDRPVWTGACPDHYLIETGADGRQEVYEVTGGAVLVSRFFVDYTDRDRVPVPADPDYPLAIAGTAWLAGGELIGGVRHQLRAEPGGGFRAKLGVAFPAAVPARNISEHQWHLAVEFGNWITVYLNSLG
ncbi:hypothetical protein EBN03_09680 [Nocardia stercoris]|uniref:Uncharacterized protein n=1 Tax=Nocardia stercoris TaxID=2483361 RepID=A0A3M2L6R7_9NOCA|nr:hypothetical protein EBN03_09680 [Nocardia stercoris]